MNKFKNLFNELISESKSDNIYETAFNALETVFNRLDKPEELSAREERFKIDLSDLINAAAKKLENIQ